MSIDELRSQYEALPYPERDPADETKRLVTGSPSDLWELNHYVFGGTRDWSRPFRALVAGGGTGDAAIMIAQQLVDAGLDGRVCHLDLSIASQNIAKERAKVRGLDNIDFHHGSLLELGEAKGPFGDGPFGNGPFDYIDCCGVLHHLDDPRAGLDALVSVLADDGGMGLMVYGSLGRTGVYHIQEALRSLISPDSSVDEQLDLARRLVANLPPTNWLVRNPFVSDHLVGGDAGLFDLLLHSRDRAYLVRELAALIGDAGLRIAGFIEPARYRPATYLKDRALTDQTVGMDMIDMAALAENLAGNMKVHIGYVVHGSNSVAAPDPGRRDMIPTLRGQSAQDAARAISSDRLSGSLEGFEFSFALPRLAKPFLERCDGTKTLAEIYGEISALRSDLDCENIERQFHEVYEIYNGLNIMHLTDTKARAL
jgi:SAM-dependent methyltransferase